MATVLNSEAYTVEADGLVRGGYPLIARTVSITNPKTALKRGQALACAAGVYSVAAAAEGSTPEIAAIVADDREADTASESVYARVYVTGRFDSDSVAGASGLTIDAATVFAAQKLGIYLD